MPVKRIIGFITTVVLILLSISTFVFRQEIIDWWKLRDYEPSAAIARLSTEASFSDTGRRLFYVHDPELLDKANFQGKCLQTEVTIVLGCYITNTKIYVFDVSDERLKGVEEVTAAHEMLHAAYDRLNPSERNRINTLLELVFSSTTDERLKETIESYRTRDPSVVPNELHSIIGTEVRDIPEELEAYYDQYFLNRSDVVALAEAYAAEFNKREALIKEFDNRLSTLESQINESESSLAQLDAALTTERQQLEALSGNPQAYNAQVPVFNQLVQNYNNRLQTLRNLIDQYNALVAERNAIATEERDLLEAIDTRTIESE